MNRKFLSAIFLLTICLASPLYSQFRTRALRDTSGFGDKSGTSRGLTTILSTQEPLGTSRSGSDLSLFGIDLFNRNLADFQQSYPEVYMLPPNYKLGPGDKLGVFLLGKVQEERELVVNVEGKVFVPPTGVIDVWGLSIEELKNLLTKKLSRFYDNFQLDIMLLQPKNVVISVVGEVIRPGKYTLSAMNTVLDAIMLAGGPTERGSIRDIQLIRNDEVFASIDLYRFLMSGDDEYDKFLQAGDRIFVALALHKVKIAGEVNRPAIFELKPGQNERLTDLMALAGGMTQYAYPNRIEISRLKEDGYRRLIYVDYREIANGDSTSNMVLNSEDQIQVYSKLEQIHERKVAIFGEIRKPGAYMLEEGMHLSDLILKAGNLTRKAYTLEAEVAKVDPGRPTEFLKVNLNKLTNGANGHTDILLEEDDQVFIRRIPDWEVGLVVYVRGEVMFPGTYSIIKDRTRLSEILQKAGEFTKEAFLQEATLVRSKNRQVPDKEFERLMQMRREELTDLEYQYLVMRQNTADVNQVVVDFEKLVKEQDRTQDVVLEHGDIIDIPKAPRVVTVTGRVANAGGVTYSPTGDLQYYLERAGGASWDANLGKTKVIKVTGEVLNDEDVKSFQPGDTIWVPRKSGKKIWPAVLQTITVAAQLASIYLIIDTAANR